MRLRRAEVGTATDDFGALGGHSAVAAVAEVAARLSPVLTRTYCQTEDPLRHFGPLRRHFGDAELGCGPWRLRHFGGALVKAPQSPHTSGPATLDVAAGGDPGGEWHRRVAASAVRTTTPPVCPGVVMQAEGRAVHRRPRSRPLGRGPVHGRPSTDPTSSRAPHSRRGESSARAQSVPASMTGWVQFFR
jgi:hypothetical protein